LYYGLSLLFFYAFNCVNSVLSGPPGPDLYANTVSFQVFVFMAGYFPLWLLALIALLLGEFAIMSPMPNNTVENSAEKPASNEDTPNL
jgi:hypothetical protein